MSTASQPAEQIGNKVRSGTVVALFLLAVILAGGLISVWPRFTVPRRVRLIARELPESLRGRYPVARLIFVKTRQCRFNHLADISVYFDFPAARRSPEAQFRAIQEWVAEQYHGVFVEMCDIRVAGGHRVFHRSHAEGRN